MISPIPLSGSLTADEIKSWADNRPYAKPETFFRRVHEEPQVLDRLVSNRNIHLPAWWRDGSLFDSDYRLWHAKTWADRRLAYWRATKSVGTQVEAMTRSELETQNTIDGKTVDSVSVDVMDKLLNQMEEQMHQRGIKGRLFPQGSILMSPMGMGFTGGFLAGWLTNVGGSMMKTQSGVWVVCPFRIRAVTACMPALFSGLFFAAILTVGGLLRGG